MNHMIIDTFEIILSSIIMLKGGDKVKKIFHLVYLHLCVCVCVCDINLVALAFLTWRTKLPAG